MDLFVRIIIPLKINKLYTYSVGNNIPDIAIGSIVLVEFRNKYYYGLIHSKIDTAPSDINIKDIKDIISVVNTLQIIDRKGILLWEHVANYYACNISDIMNLALPVSLNSIKNQSIELNHSNYDNLIESINTKEKQILELIKKYNDGLNTPITVSKLYKLIENKAELNKILFDLERLSIINIERSKPNYISPGYARIQLNSKYKIDWIFQVLKSTKSLTKTLETFLKLKDLKENVLIIDLLENGCNKNSVEKLISRRILAIEPLGVEKATLDTTNAILKDVLLTEEQHEAEQIIKKSFESLKPALLYGKTSSGKTAVYISLIKESLLNQKQILLLVPEISLSKQIYNRLTKYFNSNIIECYHSNLNDKDKIFIWNKVQYGDCNIIIGTRSAIFLPFRNLDLIIIDEEHDTSYKQDVFPYYNGKNASHFLAKIHKAKLLLGSATPSIESYYNACNDKYTLVQLRKRYNDFNMPKIDTCDISKNNIQEGDDMLIGKPLIDKIDKALKCKSQIILFQNRRGYAPIVICKNCKSPVRCIACDVSLVYHKKNKQLKCHYCGFTKEFMQRCPTCGSNHLEFKGKGTEKIEEHLKKLFPGAITQRIDADTIKKEDFSTIIAMFENKQIDILVGTQIISKGIDFSNVSLVGIVDADTILNFPDFRAFERGFQLIYQVSGRAGRQSNDSEVIIQTCRPDNYVIQYIKEGNYEDFLKDELEIRKLFNYPPFTRLINISIKGKNIDLVNDLSNYLANRLNPDYYKEMLGPEVPLIAYINYEYAKSILLKVTNEINILKESKLHLQEVIIEAKKHFKIYNSKNVLININVDY